MTRLQLQLPNRFLFETTLNVRVSDLNYGNHVGNDRMLLFFQEARVAFYRSKGITDELHLEGTVGQIVTDAMVIYKSEAFLGDALKIELGITDPNKYGFDFVYRVTNNETGNEVARGKTGIVCFDYARRKVVAVPEEVMKWLVSS